jgi:plastocyanin
MRKSIFTGIVVLTALGAYSACQSDKKGPQKVENPNAQKAAATAQKAAQDSNKEAPSGPAALPGGIKVAVKFAGEAVVPAKLNRTVDPFCAKTEKIDPSILVTEGHLENVVVRIASKVKVKTEVPSEPLKIGQHQCMYAPRVSAAVTGQMVTIANGDDTLHNVHAYRGENNDNWFNNAQPPRSPAITKEMDDMMQLKCDVHPWMSAFVSVTDHPFNTVTKTDGLVVWDKVPSKSKAYKVEAWHEVLGSQVQEVVVEAGKVSELTFTFKNEG